MFARLKYWARGIKADIIALWLAAHDPRTPWLAKLLALLVAAYALSPIDLIPDFIPVIGYIDDLLILPLGVALAIRLIPPDLLAELRERSRANPALPENWMAAAFIILVWVVGLALISVWLLHRFKS